MILYTSLFQCIINGEPYSENILSVDIPSTIAVTKDETNGGYNVEASLNFASADILGVPSLTISSHFVENPPSLQADNFPVIYFIGKAQDWNVFDSLVEIRKVSDNNRVYSGSVCIPNTASEFRFYGNLGNWDSWSIGASNAAVSSYEGMPFTPVTFNADGVYEGSVFVGDSQSSQGMGSWQLENWLGGMLGVNVDLDNGNVTFQKLKEPDALYPVFIGLNNPVDVSNSSITRTGEGTYSGIIDVPAEYLENNSRIMMYFQEDSGNLANPLSYSFIGKDNNVLNVKRKGFPSRIAVGSRGYYFTIDNYTASHLRVDVNMHDCTVTFTNPDLPPLTPEDIQMKFVNELPETLTVGKAYNVLVDYNAFELDGYSIWSEVEGSAVKNFYSRQNGRFSEIIVPTQEGELTLSITSGLHEESGFEPLVRTFRVVAPEYAATVGNEITLKGKTQSGEFNTTLTKESDGIYSGTIEISEPTFFRICFQAASGEVVLSNISSWNMWNFNDGNEYIYYNEGMTLDAFRRYTLNEIQDIQDNEIEKFYLAAPMTNGNYKFEVNLNTMQLVVTDANYVPYISAVKPEILVKTGDTFYIDIDTNIGSDIYYDIAKYVVVDNPELAKFSWMQDIVEENSVIYRFHFDTNGTKGETDIHFSSPLLKEKELEAVVHIKIDDFKIESINLSETEIMIPQGGYHRVTYTVAPVSGWTEITGISDDSDVATYYRSQQDEMTEQLTILGEKVGDMEYSIHTDSDPQVETRLKVHVLPAGSTVAEHVVYLTLDKGDIMKLNLNDHHDGSAATPTWSSSDENVATVDAYGNVRAVSEGKAVVTSDCGEHQIMTGINVMGATGVEDVHDSSVYVYSQGTAITVAGSLADQTVKVYSSNGTLMHSRVSDGGILRFDLGVKGAFVVTVAGQSFKVVL